MDKLNLKDPLITLSGFSVDPHPELLVAENLKGELVIVRGLRAGLIPMETLESHWFIVDEYGRTSTAQKPRVLNEISEEDSERRRRETESRWGLRTKLVKRR